MAAALHESGSYNMGLDMRSGMKVPINASVTVPSSGYASDTHATPQAPESDMEAGAALTATAQAIQQRLRHRRSDMQLLVNTNKLLVQRERRAAAVLSTARRRSSAQQASALSQPPALDGGLMSPEAGRLTARGQQRLFCEAGAPVVGFAPFKAHCSVTVAALTRMQAGAAAATAGVSEQTLRMEIDDYRARVAASIGMQCDDICWHFVTTRHLAPRAPLSVGLSLTTAACAASLFVMYFLLQLESGLLLAEGDMLKVTGTLAVATSTAPGGAAGGHSASDGDRGADLRSGSQGRICSLPSRRVTVLAASRAGQAPATATPAASQRSPATACEVSSAHSTPGGRESAVGNHSGGVPQHAPGHMPGQSTRRRARRDCMLPPGWPGAAGSSAFKDAQELTSAESCGSYGGGNSEAAHDPDLFIGSVDIQEEAECSCLRTGLASSLPLEPTVKTAITAMIQRFQARLPRQRLLDNLQLFLTSLELPAGDSEPEMGAGEVEAELSGSSAMHAHHVHGSFAVMTAVFQAVEEAVAAIKKGGNVPWQSSPREHEEDLERARVHFQEFMTATIALTATGQKSYFTMALSLAVPGETRFCKVESMHVRLYRALGVPQPQKLLMAALFKEWAENRGTLTHRQTDALLPLSIWCAHADTCDLGCASAVPAIAQGDAAFRLGKLPDSARVHHTPIAGRFIPVLMGRGSRDSAATLPLRRFYAEDGRLLLDSPAAWVMSKEMTAAAPGLIGQCPIATIAAAETLRRLQGVHDLTCHLYQDLQSRVMPGDLMTLMQFMHCMWCPVLHRVGPPDIVVLCQLAQQQLRWEESFAGIESLAV